MSSFQGDLQPVPVRAVICTFARGNMIFFLIGLFICSLVFIWLLVLFFKWLFILIKDIKCLEYYNILWELSL
ncbi:hypothetical protein HMPREF1548_00637 [Clostridium sp. KLE 1755]|nr:hypothetical protein HMPREF1548_00637 [Clostridium sp. KLE 1755]